MVYVIVREYWEKDEFNVFTKHKINVAVAHDRIVGHAVMRRVQQNFPDQFVYMEPLHYYTPEDIEEGNI